jgi:hypothetical protein
VKADLITKAILPVVCVFTFATPLEARTVTKGDRPPALAPYAENDPIPKLVLKPFPEQRTSRQAVESFLAYLASGINMTRVTTSGTLFGLRQGYESAWSLMTDPKPTLQDFKAQWANTARIGTTQIEAIDQRDYFVELERLEYVDSRWVISYYLGTVTTVKTGDGWRIERFSVYPEDLASINLGGHQAWLHSEISVAKAGSGMPDSEVLSISYERRAATVKLKDRNSKQTRTVRLARLMEGTWKGLNKAQFRY